MQHSYSWVLSGALLVDETHPILTFDSDFLHCGPDGIPESVVLDEIMAKRFADLARDLSRAYGVPMRQGDGTLQMSVGCPFRDYLSSLPDIDRPILKDGQHDDMRICSLPSCDEYETIYGAFQRSANDDWVLRGVILDADIAVTQTYRGLGIGSGLVAAQLIDQTRLKVWDHETPGYSNAGYACVLRGFDLAQESIRKELSSQMEMATPLF